MHRHLLLLPLLGTLLTGCLWGTVERAATGAPLADVFVTGVSLPGSGPYNQLSVVRTDSDGVYVFDHAEYDGDDPQPVTDAVYLLVYSLAGTCGAVHYVNPVYELVPHGMSGSSWIATAPSAYLSTDCTDTDGDGLPDEEEQRRGTDPTQADTDGDGLSDFAEVRGDNWTDLPSLGADPLHKDIFLEIDYVPFNSWRGRPGTGSYPMPEPPPAALDEVLEAFAIAPVPNPDGIDGVTLHILVDDEVLTPGASHLCGNGTGTARDEFQDLRDVWFDPRRRPFFHWALFTARFCGSNGVKPNGGFAVGVDFAVTLGGKFDDSWDPAPVNRRAAGTIMHELGHGLRLGHAGVDATGARRGSPNNMPHYLSVMNYTYQGVGISQGGATRIDFARFHVDGLDEAALSEEQGLTSSEVDQATLDEFQLRARVAGTPGDRHTVWIGDDGCEPEDWADSGFGPPDEGAGGMTDWSRDCAIALDPGTVAISLDGDEELELLPDAHADWPWLDYTSNGVIVPNWADTDDEDPAEGRSDEGSEDGVHDEGSEDGAHEDSDDRRDVDASDVEATEHRDVEPREASTATTWRERLAEGSGFEWTLTPVRSEVSVEDVTRAVAEALGDVEASQERAVRLLGVRSHDRGEPELIECD